MYVFVEGDPLNFDLGPNVIEVRVSVTHPLSFNSAIKLLAMHSKQPHRPMVIFTNFFSVGCKDLTDAQRRGLERIALGDNAIEVINKPERSTRFMNTMKGEKIRSQVGTLRAMAEDYTSFGIGNLSKGNILLVGERPGPNHHGFNTPFVGSGSGLWLLKQLEEANIDESRLYWVNSRDGFGVPAKQDFVKTLKPSKIIALGNEAMKWAAPLSNDYSVINVPHPQYWLRFRSGEEYPLLKMLK